MCKVFINSGSLTTLKNTRAKEKGQQFGETVYSPTFGVDQLIG